MIAEVSRLDMIRSAWLSGNDLDVLQRLPYPPNPGRKKSLGRYSQTTYHTRHDPGPRVVKGSWRTYLSFQCVHNIQCSHSFAFGIFSVSHCVANDRLQERSEHISSHPCELVECSYRVSWYINPEMRFTPPLRASLLMAGLVTPATVSERFCRKL